MTVKMKRYKQILLFIVLSATLFGCNDWLDVSPKTEIKAGDNFNNEQGYKDALTGVYLLMTDESLYGRELTFGLNDALAQYYTGIPGTSHPYYYPSIYAYDNDASVAIFDNIWSNMYKAIANDNELIENIETADESMFTGRNYNLIKGEAYGLRAFLHFDLLRLFAPSYASDPNADAIPYVTKVGTKVTALLTVDEVLKKVLDDLSTAETYLINDPVVDAGGSGSIDEEYERDRFYKFNYYAAKLLEARIYLYMSDYDKANEAAQAIINQNYFTWTPDNEITTSNANDRNYVFSEELIFALYDNNLTDSYSNYFTGTTGLYMQDNNYEGLYELNKTGYYADYRYTYVTNLLSSDNIRVSTKLKQPTGGTTAYLHRMPLMRISEAYYIAAECALKNNNTSSAIDDLTTVRVQRNLPDDLSQTLTSDEVQDEIYKEYAKEFMCEGQLFYYFKRLNLTYIKIPSVSGGSLTYSYVTPGYVLPMPDDEIEYGGRSNE